AVPAPSASAVGVRLQPSTALDQPVTLPTGAAVAQVVAIDVFDPTTGVLIHEHARPLTLTLRLTEGVRAVCTAGPRRVALLHVEAGGRVTRVPATLDCASGTLSAQLATTSAYAVVVLDTPSAVPFWLFVPLGR